MNFDILTKIAISVSFVVSLPFNNKPNKVEKHVERLEQFVEKSNHSACSKFESLSLNSFGESALENNSCQEVNKDCYITINHSKEEVINQIKYGFDEDILISLNSKQFDSLYLNTQSNLHICDILYENGYLFSNEYNHLLFEIIDDSLVRNEECLTKYVKYLAFDCEYDTDEFRNDVENYINNPEERLIKNNNRNINNPVTYTQGNFSIVVSSGSSITTSTINQTFAHLESTRLYYLNAGFNLPRLQSGKSTYYVYLDSGSNGGALGTCFGTNASGNVCASYFYVYDFLTLTDQKKETIAHEYFHAIQYSYNYRGSWFSEASANLSKMIVCHTTDSINGWQHEAISNFVDSMESTAGYQFFYFPLVLYVDYGGIDTIRLLYEKYHNVGVSINEKYFKVIVTETLKDLGYSADYDTVFRRMCQYIYNPTKWFATIASSTQYWTRSASDYATYNLSSSSYINISLDSGTAKFFRASIPSSYNSKIKIYLSESISKAHIDFYFIKKDGTHLIDRTINQGADRSNTIPADMASNLSYLGIIVSNPFSDSYSGTLNVVVTTPTTYTFSATDRMIEICGSLNAGEEVFEKIRFNSSGEYVLQTFGPNDCIITIYDSSGTYIDSNDDEGFDRNSLLKRSFSSGVEYRISICFWNSTISGSFKILILKTSGVLESGITSLKKIEDIRMLTYSSTSLSYSNTLKQAETDLYRFKSSKNADFVFDISTTDNIDTYLYVLDPTETTPIKLYVDYDDDSGNGYNGQMKKDIKANKEYLIMICQYNPNTSYSNRNYTLNISETNDGPKVPTSMNYLEIYGVKKSSTKWTVTFMNPNPYRVRVEYNSKMCFGDDAKNYTNLYDIKAIHLGAYEVISVVISENLFAGYITLSLKFIYNSSTKRMVTYANNLSNASCYLTPHYHTI